MMAIGQRHQKKRRGKEEEGLTGGEIASLSMSKMYILGMSILSSANQKAAQNNSPGKTQNSKS
jgi:hypothetical protein